MTGTAAAALVPILTREDGYKRALAILPKAFKELEDILDTGEPREKLDASRVLAQVIGHLAPSEEPKPPAELPAEREARLKRLLANSEVREWIVKELAETGAESK